MIYQGLAFICLVAAAGLLAALSVIDLKTRLLPNKLTLPLALLAPLFHFATHNDFLSWMGLALGGLLGFGIMYGLRAVANYIYKEDALGLGDVKLIGAAGLWLGPENVMLAMAAGAFAAMLHGLGYGLWLWHKTGSRPDFGKMGIPAGPGFAVGIVAAAIMMLAELRVF